MNKYPEFTVTDLGNKHHIPQYFDNYEDALGYYQKRIHDKLLTDWIIVCRPQFKRIKKEEKNNA